MSTIIAGAVIALLMVFAVRYIIKQHKAGKCAGGCGGCSGCGVCPHAMTSGMAESSGGSAVPSACGSVPVHSSGAEKADNSDRYAV